jgi:DNA replication protein DnaC
MKPGDIDLFALLKRLHLPTVARLLPELEVRAAKEALTHREFVAILMAEEVSHRNDTRVQKAVRNAKFPFAKTIEEFDFTFQSSIKRAALGPWLGPEFVTEGRNLILSGKPGRGKTHLAIALAYRAIQNGFDARFVKASALIDELCAAARAGRLREATAEYVEPDVIVIDEIGYLHHANDAANVLYGVVDQRCTKRKPIVFTTNKPLKQWGWVLHDPDLAEALLDRVLEHGTHVELTGTSFRSPKLDLTMDPSPSGGPGTTP